MVSLVTCLEHPNQLNITMFGSFIPSFEPSLAMQFMDLASFLCVNLVLRSMIFGIVLASFAQLREKESKALEEMKVCT